MRAAALAALILLGGCGKAAPRDDAAGLALERAAITTGMIRDPAAGTIAGLYARDTDRLCLVSNGSAGYRVGASVDYGAGQGCSARGTATRDGATLRLLFDGVAGCRFVATIDEDRIAFPGDVPDVCDQLCSGRASLAALDVTLLSDAGAEAIVLHDRRGRPLCGR